jgi:hypothetical protein
VGKSDSVQYGALFTFAGREFQGEEKRVADDFVRQGEANALPASQKKSYLGNSVTGVSRSKGPKEAKFGWTILVQSIPVHTTSCSSTYVVEINRPPARNNIVPGMITRKPANWQSRTDQPRFCATEAKILAQKKTLAPTLQTRAQIKPIRLMDEKLCFGKARIPRHAT